MINNLEYKEKYLKYKEKYLNQFGGSINLLDGSRPVNISEKIRKNTRKI
jgi:hypothetical protein